MRRYFFNVACLLLTMAMFSPGVKAIPATNWEAIFKPVEFLQGYSWGTQQGRGRGGDDDDNYSSGDDDDHYNSGDDDDHYSNDDDDDSSEIPLDGGLSFLAAAGAGLGIKKLRDNRAKKKSKNDSEQ